MNGYVRCPHALLCNPAVSDTELRVWLFIAGQQDGFKYTAEQAAKAIGKSRRAWHYAVARLEKIGLLEITHFRGSKSNRYRAVLTNLNAMENAQPAAHSNAQEIAQCAENCTINAQDLHNQCANFAHSHLINRQEQLQECNSECDAHTRERETEQLKKHLATATQWAQAMCMNYNINTDELMAALNDAHTYCLSNDLAPDEPSLKRYAQQALRLTPRADLRRRATLAKPKEQRRQWLLDEIKPHLERFGKDVCNRFFNYWTEPDGDGLLRYETQDHWDTLARLKRFATK